MRRIKTPTILQMEATECGAAALAIVLAYYGQFIPLEKLRIECSVTRDGCNALVMLKAAQKHRLIAQGIQIESIDELTTFKAPLILFWEFNHFVVLEGIKGKKVYINDPASGPRVINIEQFSQSFTGIVLILKPDKDFKKIGTPPRLFTNVMNRLNGMGQETFFVLLSTLLVAIPTLLIIGFAKVFIDFILIEAISSWWLPFLTLFLLNSALIGLLSWLQGRYLLLLKIKLLMVGSVRLVWHIMCLPVNFFQQRLAGDISERIGANDRIAHLLSAELSTAMVGLLTLIIYGFILVLMSWQLAIIAFVATAFNYFVYRLIARRYFNLSFDFLQKNSKLLGLSMSGLYLIDDLKANGRENDFFQRWSALHAEVIYLQQQQSIFTQILNVIPLWAQIMTVTAILCYGSLLIINGIMTIGTLVAFQLLFTQFTQPLQAMLVLGSDLQKIKGDLLRQDDVLNYEIDPRLLKSSAKTTLFPSIELKNVSFSYLPLKPMLKELMLSIKAGEMVALTGQSGGGKSTIAKLIAGLYQPQQGCVLIGGVSVNEIHANNLATQLGYVDQDIFLYSGTIRQNMDLGKTKLDDEAIEKALKDACLFDLIKSRGGLDSVVLENGINFSGGQRQRIEMARVLAQNPSMLILDEATANLDAKTEEKILANIKKRKCTTLIISHRRAIFKYCDSVYVLEKGQLKQCGEEND